MGLSVAVNVRVGNALGAGNIEQAKKSSVVALLVTGAGLDHMLGGARWGSICLCSRGPRLLRVRVGGWGVPAQCAVFFLPPELVAIIFCVLLLSCKDLVGYIFTSDRCVMGFSCHVKSGPEK